LSEVLVVTKPGCLDEFLQIFPQARSFPNLTRVAQLPGTVSDFQGHPLVESVEPADIPIYAAQDITIDANLGSGNWGLIRTIRRSFPWSSRHLRLPGTWGFNTILTGLGVDVYIVDSGIRTTHTEFGGRATKVYDATGGSGDDGFGHGTGTSSVAAGATVGLARQALIFSFRVLDNSGSGTTAWFIDAVSQLISHYSGRTRPAVVNLSLEYSSSAINASVTDMINAGLIVIAAAGNAKSDLATINQYPAESDSDVIVVGGTNMIDQPYYFSNFGSAISLVAPSSQIYLATRTSDSAYTTSSGTSLGCALTTGVMACRLQGKSKLTSRSEVQAAKTALLSDATTGKLHLPDYFPQGSSGLPDKILYLNPFAESISW
jgi:subtilisin family serine protease